MSQAIVIDEKKDHSIADIRANYKNHFSSIADMHAFLTQFGVEWSKKRMTMGVSEKVQDKVLVQMSNALDHLTRTENEFLERLQEMYVLIDPSFNGTESQLISAIVKNVSDLKEYALFVQSSVHARRNLEDEIKKKALEVMPNFSSVVEPLIAAKLLAMAGSMQKLSSMTSSTLQLLGAEKALFRHLKDRRISSPKYGIIYNSRYIQNAPEELRGKVARLLASKLMIAARIDFYSDRNESVRLQNELKDELANLRKQSVKQPIKPVTQEQRPFVQRTVPSSVSVEKESYPREDKTPFSPSHDQKYNKFGKNQRSKRRY